MRKNLRTQPDENLEELWNRMQSADGLDYALHRLGDLDPDAVALGSVEGSDQAKIEAGQNWWGRNQLSVKRYVCQSQTIRDAGPLTVLQAVFGTLAHFFGGPIATYATVILIKKQFGSTINSLGKDALDQWCGDLRPKRRTARKNAPKRRAKGKGASKKAQAK